MFDIYMHPARRFAGLHTRVSHAHRVLLTLVATHATSRCLAPSAIFIAGATRYLRRQVVKSVLILLSIQLLGQAFSAGFSILS